MPFENPKQYPNNKLENWIAYRESPEFKRGIKSLEDLKGRYGPSWKITILAVALNVKKAASVEYIRDEDSEQIERVFSDLGIFFNRDKEWSERYLKRFPDIGPLEDIKYQVGATQEDLEEIMRLEGVFGEVEISNLEYGRALDYPETAVKAYAEYGETGNADLLLNIYDPRITEDEQAFTNSRLSEANWEEEIQWREQIMAATLEYSPKIYNEMIESFQTYLEKKRERERIKNESKKV
jgi:hypothetical protein